MRRPNANTSIARIQDALAIMASYDPGYTLRAEHDIIYGSELPLPDEDSYAVNRLTELGWLYENGVGWYKYV